MASTNVGTSHLRADCASCVGLCCVALPFARSADFAIDKPAGMPCPHLRGDDGCGIHAELRTRGFPGCDTFDCFGAGQQVTQVTFGGASWRDDLVVAPAMFGVFPVMQAVHEMRWYLDDAGYRSLNGALKAEVAALARRLADVSSSSSEALTSVDVDRLRAEVGDALARVSSAVRADLGGAVRARADHAGQDLRGVVLRGADLRGALLIAADLRSADLSCADLLGADLRGADLRGADLRDALFLTRPQLAAARGDAATRIPSRLDRPAHWGHDASSSSR